MSSGLAVINRALNLIPKRAESRQAERLRDTFVDSGVAAALEAIDDQVLYGRRGTGKTHALRYLETTVGARGGIAVYVDLRTIGSPDGLFAGLTMPPTERAARLLVDLLGQVHDALLAAAIDDEALVTDVVFVRKLDDLLASITTIRIVGDVEVSREGEQKDTETTGAGVSLGFGPKPSAEVRLSTQGAEERRELLRETRRGTEQRILNFSDVARALRELAATLATRRVWLLLDEWSSIPPEIQPFLGEFLVRCVLPLQMFTVKIAAIEQQSNFRAYQPDGLTIGIELGADVAANLDLDEFMVFEQNEDKARSFFKGLLFKHLTSGVDLEDQVDGLDTEADLVSMAFTDRRAFDELVRAAEGVPRDALNIAAKAALRAAERKVSVPDVRSAARAWFQADKEAALRGREEAQRLLNWIIDKVIKQKRARGFMVNQKATGAPLLRALFDARVLHVVRRGYSAQDEPGERYDVYVIDYGAYVDLIHTKYEPLGVLPFAEDGGYTDVPSEDLRALRRAILDLDEFHASADGSEEGTATLTTDMASQQHLDL
jgi:hypothetical protein